MGQFLDEIEEGSARDAEITGPFVTAAVLSVKMNKAVNAFYGFVYPIFSPWKDLSEYQIRDKDIGVDPGVPVINRVIVAKPHPREIILFQKRHKDAAEHFLFNAAFDFRDFGGNYVPKEIVNPGKQRTGFRGEEVNVNVVFGIVEPPWLRIGRLFGASRAIVKAAL